MDNKPSQNRRQVQRLIRHFRILKGWRVQCCRHKTLQAHLTFWPKSKQAVIYDAKGKIPSCFLLHEILHLCLAALWMKDKRRPKEIHQAEETLVQDILALLPNVGQKD